MVERWHKQFSPERFLSRINLEELIKKNEAYNENKVDTLGRPCYLCNGLQGPGILLNDKSYLCKLCLEKVSRITYPERYEILYREYLLATEARKVARASLIDKSFSRRTASLFGWLGAGSLLLLFKSITFVIVPLSFGLLFLLSNNIHARLIKKWDSEYPGPAEPSLKNFHDPDAVLTPADLQILYIFNHWPGYPPFWRYLREIVLHRDGNRCQVSGCPSRVELHIHHIIAVSQSGEHVPSNLVTLCDFHHALEPAEGHERIWGNIKNRYFTMVRSHKRKNPVSPGYHFVKAHVRRLELICESEIEGILKLYGVHCPSCDKMIETFDIDRRAQKVELSCDRCQKRWLGARKLAEETGPRIAEKLKISKNLGRWKCNWSMLEHSNESIFRVI